MSDEKIRVFQLGGGPQDLGELSLDTMEQVVEMIKQDIEETNDSEIEEYEWTISIKLMTRDEYNNLPEYDF